MITWYNKYIKNNKEVILLERQRRVIENTMSCRHLVKAPRSYRQLLSKCNYNPEHVNTEALIEIFKNISLKRLENINRIHILTSEDIMSNHQLSNGEKQSILQATTLGLYTFVTGNIIINLTRHCYLNRNRDQNKAVVYTLLHEARHATQMKEGHRCFNSFKNLVESGVRNSTSDEFSARMDLEQDADRYAATELSRLLNKIQTIPNNLVNWDKVERDSSHFLQF